MEEGLRKQEKLRGTPILLGNGEEWIIPSLPLNDDGERIAQLHIDIIKKEEEGIDNKGAMALYFDLMYAITILNYPTLTEDTAKKESLFDIAMLGDFILTMTGAPPKA